jgi:hypothetical protein
MARYRVVGSQLVCGFRRGQTFEHEFTGSQEKSLIEGGHILPAPAPLITAHRSGRAGRQPAATPQRREIAAKSPITSPAIRETGEQPGKGKK